MKAWVTGLGALFAGAVFASAAMAGQCGYDYCWGAVGIGPSGEWGWANNHMHEDEAIWSVQQNCPGCNNIKTFYNTCGAMAVGSNGAWGFGWAASRGQAEGNAIGYCSEHGAGCTPVVWSCSN